MKDDIPGNLRIRMGFARVYGGGPDQGKLRPSLEVTDGTSGKSVTIELTAEDIAEMLSGSEVSISADKVSGFKSFVDFGKYHQMTVAYVPTEAGDYRVEDPRALPHVGEVMDRVEAEGYRCEAPRRNNKSQWVIIGRKYTDEP